MTTMDELDTASTQAQRALDEALKLAHAGYKLTPVTVRRGPTGKKRAQFHNGWRHESSWSCDPALILQWWVDHPDTSFALGCGVNGIEGVDLDVKPAGKGTEAVDAPAQWAAQGLPISSFVQYTPSGGMHTIWRVREDGLSLPQDQGKLIGRGFDTRNRSGLFFATGGYVLGERGHYEGNYPPLAQLAYTPLEVVELFAEAAGREQAQRPSDGRIVTHDETWQQMQITRALDAIRGHRRDDGGYRTKLQHAGLMLGRAVEQGFLSMDNAQDQILDAHRSVWGKAVWAENVTTIRDALADGPRLERWRTPDPRAGSSSGDEDVTLGGPHDPDSFLHDVALEMRRQDIREQARQMRAVRDREPLQVLSFDEFLDSPKPAYLVPRMLYVNSTAKFYGGPGSSKSFLLLDIALSMATGTPWNGVALARTRAHFVMAEGQAVNVSRALAWLHDRGVPRAEGREWFAAIPQGVMLTEQGIAAYLERLRQEKPGLIVLDTKNAMMAGEENSASDVAVMVRSMRAMRDAADGACVVLVDHTGMGDTSRGRGSNAVTAAMDTEIRVENDEESGALTAQVTRDKSAMPGARWEYTLRAVPGVPGVAPDEPVPAVVSWDSERRSTRLLRTEGAWHDLNQPEIPAELSGHAGDGWPAAKDAFRVLRFVGDEDGLTIAQIERLLREGPRTHGPSTIRKGVTNLVNAGFAYRPERGRAALEAAFLPPRK